MPTHTTHSTPCSPPPAILSMIPMLLGAALTLPLSAQTNHAPLLQAELVFPYDSRHNHAPGIVECPNGDLLVSWYRGSGERRADDVAVYGSRRRRGTRTWSTPFVMADRPGFPDCNTCMMIDDRGKLWLFWPTIIANTWESCLTNVRVSSDYSGDGPPKWSHQDVILLKPDNFAGEYKQLLQSVLTQRQHQLSDEIQQEIEVIRKRLDDRLYQRLGWQPRCKPTILPSGRILLPLYSDTYSISIMAVSDDRGRSWYASQPLIGLGNIQPTVLRRNDGTLLAYMRENGVTGRIRVAESKDDGLHWGQVYSANLPNPGAGIDGVRLENGHWILVYNDTTSHRHQLAISLSHDEGKTWQWTRHLEQDAEGRFHYPAVIQARDGTIHVVYSYHVRQGGSMKHVRLNEDWIRHKDQTDNSD